MSEPVGNTLSRARRAGFAVKEGRAGTGLAEEGGKNLLARLPTCPTADLPDLPDLRNLPDLAICPTWPVGRPARGSATTDTGKALPARRCVSEADQRPARSSSRTRYVLDCPWSDAGTMADCTVERRSDDTWSGMWVGHPLIIGAR